jgi:hypothetical protein
VTVGEYAREPINPTALPLIVADVALVVAHVNVVD